VERSGIENFRISEFQNFITTGAPRTLAVVATFRNCEIVQLHEYRKRGRARKGGPRQFQNFKISECLCHRNASTVGGDDEILKFLQFCNSTALQRAA
jgi:hypothetical protein